MSETTPLAKIFDEAETERYRHGLEIYLESQGMPVEEFAAREYAKWLGYVEKIEGDTDGMPLVAVLHYQLKIVDQLTREQQIDLLARWNAAVDWQLGCEEPYEG